MVRLYLFIGVFLVLSPSVMAQMIIEQRPFAYGTLVVLDNNAIHSMNIQRNGNITGLSSRIVPLITGDSARYRLESFPPTRLINISFTPTQLVGADSSYFEIDNFSPPPIIITNISGQAEINVGSRFKTSGTAIPYGSGNYSGDTILTITY